jgi:hypothetical protein
MIRKNRNGGIVWPQFEKALWSKLGPKEDVALWQEAIDQVISDAEATYKPHLSRRLIFAQIGQCSHWLAPNKARWLTRVGEFAWPSGYEVKGGWLGGLPEFDWSKAWRRMDAGHWEAASKIEGKRPLVLRVSIPAKTASRYRASVHTIWMPDPCGKVIRSFFGFRRATNTWKLCARMVCS